MKSRTVIRRTRLAIYVFCIVIAGMTFFRLKAVSDPLTRYPYGTPEERDRLTLLLNDEEINTLINMQLQPEQVLPFAQADEFSMNNILFYNQAMETQKADPQFIVYFVNQYRNRMDLSSLASILEWMSYTDLIDYYESGMTRPLLNTNPNTLTTVLRGDTTLARWQPSDLKEIAPGVMLRFEAAHAWEKMKEAAASDGVDLTAQSGFMNIDSQQGSADYPSYAQGSYGTREEQLGLTVHLEGFDQWNEALSGSDDEYDYAAAFGAMSEEQKEEIQWLSENSWKYGWIVRYPELKESETGRSFQPFVLRYVGTLNARRLFEKGLTLDEFSEQPSA